MAASSSWETASETAVRGWESDEAGSESGWESGWESGAASESSDCSSAFGEHLDSSSEDEMRGPTHGQELMDQMKILLLQRTITAKDF